MTPFIFKKRFIYATALFSQLVSETSGCTILSSAVRDYFLSSNTNVSCVRRTTSFQMMADHGDLCDEQDATYCMNGGTCYKIHSMNTLSCVCNESFKGSRCEQFQLFSSNANTTEAGLIAAVVIVVLLILVILAVVIYYIHRMLKAKQQSQQNNQPQYWRVKPRV